MKTPIILSLLIALLFLSCTDESTTGPNASLGFIEAEVNGVIVRNTMAPATLNIDTTFTGVAITGLEAIISPDTPTLVLSITHPHIEPLAERQYLFDSFCFSIDEICATLFFNTGVSLASAPIDEGSLVLNIESLDLRPGGHIQGTFSGTLIDDQTDDFVSVENGMFNNTII